MSQPATSKRLVSGTGADATSRHYKREYWSKENLKFSQPWYRLEKTSRLISRIAGGRECDLLDVGCGPATLMRMLPGNINYYGIDIAVHNPAPNLLEADLIEAPIRFEDKRFDVVIAQGFFEYVGGVQARKFAEIAELLKDNGTFILTYTNFGHRKKKIYESFSNMQPLDDFRADLAGYFRIDRVFPASHNWKHEQPNKRLVKAANMRVNTSIPVVSPLLAVEYLFVCSLP